MSRRYKVVTQEHKKYNLEKKRERIRITVDVILSALLLLGVVIGGIYQSNSTVIGCVFITMGIISIPVVAFHIYMEVMGWRILFWYDNPEYKNYAPERMKDEHAAETKFVNILEIIIIALFSIGIIIAGILKLLNVI